MDGATIDAVLRFFPLLFFAFGVGFLGWVRRHPLPGDLQPDVLAATSQTEALPAWSVFERLPAHVHAADVAAVDSALEGLRERGLVVRWYEEVALPGGGVQRQAVYRRVGHHES